MAVSNLLLLRAAVAGLIPATWPASLTAPSIHEGEVREANPPLPWVVWNVSLPDGAFRGENATTTAHRLTATFTVAARSEAEASLILREIALDVDGEQPYAPGWNCGALIPHQPPRVWADSIDLAGASVRGFVGVASWRFVATDLPSS